MPIQKYLYDTCECGAEKLRDTDLCPSCQDQEWQRIDQYDQEHGITDSIFVTREAT